MLTGPELFLLVVIVLLTFALHLWPKISTALARMIAGEEEARVDVRGQNGETGE